MPLRIEQFGIFHKLGAAFLLVILPLCMISILMNQSGSEAVREQIGQSLQSRTHFYIRSFDADFSRLLKLRNEMLLDSDLQSLSFLTDKMSDYEYAQTVLRVQQKLQLLQTSSLYLDGVQVYISGAGRNISPQGFVPLPGPERLRQLEQSSLYSPIVYLPEGYAISGFYPEPYGAEQAELQAEQQRQAQKLQVQQQHQTQHPQHEVLQHQAQQLQAQHPQHEVQQLQAQQRQGRPEQAAADSPDSNLLALTMTLSEAQIRQSLSEINQTLQGGAALIHSDFQWMIANAQDHRAGAIRHALQQLGERNGYPGTGTLNVDIEGEEYTLVYEYSDVLNAVLAVYVPEAEILGPLATYRGWFWLFAATSAVVVLVFSYWIYRNIHQPIRRMVLALRKVEQGMMNVMLKHRPNDEFGYMYNQFNKMVGKLNMLIHEVYEQRIRSQRAELKQLQSQINPHFLYNSFFVLHRVAQMQDMDKVLHLTRHLGEYFRYITRTGSDEVTLAEELNHARAYIEIQMQRYSRRVQTICGELPEQAQGILVPRLILQPLLENAYEHGLENKVSGGKVQVQVQAQVQMQVQGVVSGTAFIIRIEDNGDELTDQRLAQMSHELLLEEPLETTGLLNIHRRLVLKFGPASGLRLSRSALGGLAVDVVLPTSAADAGKELHHV